MIFILNYIILSISILISVTVLEYTKAFVSTKLGDVLPKNQKRLTLNPFKHFEIVGFILFLFCGYGWGKPIETSSLYYKNKKLGTILTYTLPILASLFLAFLSLLLYKFFNFYDFLSKLLYTLSTTSINLAVFNLLPVYPFCGYKILTSFLNPNQVIVYSQYDKIIQMLIIIFLISGHFLVPLNIVSGFIKKILVSIIF